MSLTFHAPLLRAVAERLHLPTVLTIARAAGVIGVWRVTVHYCDGRHPDSVTTLIRRTGGGTTLERRSQRLDDRPIVRPMSDARWETFTRALTGLRFDSLADQPDLPVYDTTDLWLIERAAGIFVHSVIVAPDRADAVWQQTGRESWARLVSAVRNGLPEAVTPQESA
ncbi:MAG: hypothetical protein ACUVS2_11705 [Candidatus Flexifilum sp.]